MRQTSPKSLSAQTSVFLGTLASLTCGVSGANAALLVGNTEGNNVVIFDERTGKFGGEFIATGAGGLTSPDDLTYGPDGNLYVSSGNETSGAILKFDGKTGDFLGRFDQGGRLLRPYGNAFGPDGNLYVSSFRSDEILRFDGITGQFLDVFAFGTGVANGLNGPNGLLFDQDGNLYVTTQGSVADGKGGIDFRFESQVLRYNIFADAPEPAVFVPQPTPSPDSFNFVSFLGLEFGADGDLFVSDFANDIRRYDLLTGDLVDTLSTNYTGTVPSNNFMGGLTFDPNGTLYTVGFDLTQGNQGAILRFDGETGDPLPAAGESGPVFVSTTPNLKRPIGITYSPVVVPEPALTLGLLAVGAVFAGRKKGSFR
jgi:DNA-binding beta-propeller fold protein YncE